MPVSKAHAQWNGSTVGSVPGLDEQTFRDLAARAKAGCPVSRALAGVPEVTLEASLKN